MTKNKRAQEATPLAEEGSIESSTIVCVLGMHRSGTSLLANILGQCGVKLGPDREIMPPSPTDNPDGYWENLHFVDLNDRILAELGGSWDVVPKTPEGWVGTEEFRNLREEAEGVLNSFSRERLWGWKDPRTMLTLEFWQVVMPPMKFVMLVRNPVEVAVSLGKRESHGVAFDEAIVLWRQYYETALKSIKPDQCLIVHYDSLQRQPQLEVKRIAKYLRLRLTSAQVAEASAVVDSSLHRNVFPKLLEESLPIDRKAQRIYSMLCSKAGEPYEVLSTAATDDMETVVKRATSIIQVLIKGYNDVRKRAKLEVRERDHALSRAETDANRQRAECQRLTEALGDLRARIQNSEKAAAALRLSIETAKLDQAQKAQAIANLRQDVQNASAKVRDANTKAQDLARENRELTKMLQDSEASNREQSQKRHMADVERIQMEVVALKGAKMELEQKNEELQRELNVLKASFSWRSTKPLRALGKLFKG